MDPFLDVFQFSRTEFIRCVHTKSYSRWPRGFHFNEVLLPVISSGFFCGNPSPPAPVQRVLVVSPCTCGPRCPPAVPDNNSSPASPLSQLSACRSPKSYISYRSCLSPTNFFSFPFSSLYTLFYIMASQRDERYYTAATSRPSKSSPPGDPQCSGFFQTGQGGRTVLPPLSSAFPTSCFPGRFSTF